MCHCAERARVMLPQLGWTLTEGIWTHPRGQPFADAQLSDEHFWLTFGAVLAAARELVA
jgi:hypothetical protein